jgi:CheY-like chemotaxis protein
MNKAKIPIVDEETSGPDAARGHSLSQSFYDIALLLESADDSEVRVTRVLARLHALVPYERCAVLEAVPGRESRLITAPGTSADVRARLELSTQTLFVHLAEQQTQAVNAASSSSTHLAVPLNGLGNVVGVLFVDRAEGGYDAHHLRVLSVVAANLAAYFSMLSAFAREAERAEELAQARRTAETADRAKDEFLALVSHELGTPLNSILAWADALRSTDTSDTDRKRAVEAIERAVHAQAKLVADLLAPRAAGPAAASARDWVEPRALTGINVLIVDDDPDIGEVLQFVLEAQGATVSVALSAAAALRELTRSMPDVLLSDLAMPGGSGYELMRDVIAREGERAPPAAALSAYAPGQDLREALASGFRMLLEKPIAPAALIRAVATLAGEKTGRASNPLRVERALVD